MNAWTSDDQSPLSLTDMGSISGEGTGSFTHSLFDAYNARRLPRAPVNLTNESTLGSPYAFQDASSAADPDFMIQDPTSSAWKLNQATSIYDTLRYTAAFSGTMDLGGPQWTGAAYNYVREFNTVQKNHVRIASILN